MSNSEKLFEIISLVKKFKQKEVLHIDRLSLEPGKIYGIMGPSGAGKSTLLRILNLLCPPTEGKIFFRNRDLYALQPKEKLTMQRQMAMVFQKPVLFNTTVRENVAYGLKIRGAKPGEIKKKVDMALDWVGLNHLAERNALSLSGGESQRVALARAIVLDIDVLLLDEPTANLDPGNITIIEELIKRLHRERKLTVIMVTHNIFQAQRIAREVIFFHDGQLVEKAPVEKIFSSPKDKRTLQFIRGEMIY